MTSASSTNDGIGLRQWLSRTSRGRIAVATAALVVLFELLFSFIELVTAAIVHFSVLCVGLYVALTLADAFLLEFTAE